MSDSATKAGVQPVDLGYDPWDPSFVADPYPALARLRDVAPVIFDERTNQWLVSRHADVNALLRDRRLGRSYLHVASHEEWGRTPPPADQAPFWDLLAVQMIDMEPPDHTRLRRLVMKAFTPRTVEALRPRIETIVDRVIDGALALGEFDLIADLLELVPVIGNRLEQAEIHSVFLPELVPHLVERGSVHRLLLGGGGLQLVAGIHRCPVVVLTATPEPFRGWGRGPRLRRPSMREGCLEHLHQARGGSRRGRQ